MNAKQYLIGVDAGTQGTKAGIYDTDGALVCAHFAPTQLIYRGTAVEQNPDELYASVLDAIRGAMEASGADASQVLGLSIDGQMAGAIGVGKMGGASTPYDSWLDNRCEKYIGELRRMEERIIALSGGSVTNHLGPKVLWWMHEYPNIWNKTCAFVSLSAYLSMRLCERAEPYIDDTHLHFTGFADNQNRRWDDELARSFGDIRSKLPQILRCTEIVGGLSRAAAEITGLTQGLPVAAGCGDTAASALGAGVTRPGMALDVAGTASVLAMSTDTFVPDTKYKTLLYMRSVLDKLYTPLAYIGGGGLCVRWVSQLLGKTYDELEALANEVPLGSEGLRFVPHFAGRVCPSSPHMPGAWYGMKWNHGPGELYRSVLESIASEYKGYHDILLGSAASDSGGVILGSGGGVKSRLLCRLKADALQMEYAPLARADTALFGSAVVAGMAVGVYNLDGTGIPAPEKAYETFKPREGAREAWNQIALGQARFTEAIESFAQEEDKWLKKTTTSSL